MSSEKGQSLLEVIVVMTVGVIIIGSLVFATIASLRNAQFAKNQTQATKLAQEAIEEVRSARTRDGVIRGLQSGDLRWNDDGFWNLRIDDTCTQPCYFKLADAGQLDFLSSASNSLPDSSKLADTQFKRVVVLSDDAQNNSYKNEKKVTVIVGWIDYAGEHQSRLTTILRRL